MITTVCMNPSFDKTAAVTRLQTGGLNRLEDVRYDVGGKGLNVAIVLKRMGVETACVGCVGEEDEKEFMAMVRREGIDFRTLRLAGNTRTNLKILDLETKAVTEFNEPGLSMEEDQLRTFIKLLKAEAAGSRFVVFSGRLPRNCGDDTYRRCMAAVRGVDCVLDAGGNALRLGLAEGPYLVKPNLPELEELLQRELKTLRAIRDAALELVEMGARNVLVSMGKFGAVYTDGKRVLYAPAAQVEACSTVGAGDAMVGGALAALSAGEPWEGVLQSGVAAGCASVITNGTQLIRLADYQALLPKIAVQEL